MIELDPASSPQTVQSFVFLARQGFYDGTVIHRILTDFVFQGGDPSANGTGGPGYSIADETVIALEPDLLVHVAGPFTIASMYCFAIVIAVLNTAYLPAPLRMPRWKLVGMYWAVVLWGWFSAEQVSRSSGRTPLR